MWNIVSGNLSAAAGIAASVMPIVALIVVLTSPRGRQLGPLYTLGWITGVGGGLALAVSLGTAADASTPDSAGDTGVDVVGVVVGFLLLFLAYRSLRNRPTPGQPVDPPSWLASLETLSGAKILALGFAAVVLNPKNLSLYATIGGDIARRGLETQSVVGGVVILTLIGSLGALVPLGVMLLAGDKADATLAAWREWLIQNNAVIGAVILGIFGLSILGKALGS